MTITSEQLETLIQDPENNFSIFLQLLADDKEKLDAWINSQLTLGRNTGAHTNIMLLVAAFVANRLPEVYPGMPFRYDEKPITHFIKERVHGLERHRKIEMLLLIFLAVGQFGEFIQALKSKHLKLKQTNKELHIFWQSLAAMGMYPMLAKAIDESLLDSKLMDAHGQTVWHIMARHHPDKLILAVKARLFDPEKTIDKDGNTVWHTLALNGHFDALTKAIKQGLFDPNSTLNSAGETVWHSLARAKRYDHLITAINKGFFNPYTTKDKYGNTVWHLWALQNNSDQLIQAIRDKIFDPKILIDKSGNTVWYYVDHETLIKAADEGLLDYEMPINHLGDTVLHTMAAEENQEKLMQVIREKKIVPDSLINNEGDTIWHVLLKTDTPHSDSVILEAITENIITKKSIARNRDGKTIFDIMLTKGIFIDNLPLLIDKQLIDINNIKRLGKTNDKLHGYYSALLTHIKQINNAKLDEVDSLIDNSPWLELTYALLSYKVLQNRNNKYAYSAYKDILKDFICELFDPLKVNDGEQQAEVARLIMNNPYPELQHILYNLEGHHKGVLTNILFIAGEDNPEVLTKEWINFAFELTNLALTADGKSEETLTKLLPVIIIIINHKHLLIRDLDEGFYAWPAELTKFIQAKLNEGEPADEIKDMIEFYHEDNEPNRASSSKPTRKKMRRS